jgi:hypothetical protein
LAAVAAALNSLPVVNPKGVNGDCDKNRADQDRYGSERHGPFDLTVPA